MKKTMIAAVALIALTGAAQATTLQCDFPVGKNTASTYIFKFSGAGPVVDGIYTDPDGNNYALTMAIVTVTGAFYLFSWPKVTVKVDRLSGAAIVQDAASGFKNNGTCHTVTVTPKM